MDTQAPDLEKFDALIIGAGQAAEPLAIALGEAGWKTAVIERKQVGGSCVNFGCTPTKAMAASARVAYLARRAGDYGVRTGPVEVELASVMQRRNMIVSQFRDSVQEALEGADNVELIFGHAAFEGPHALAVRLNAGGSRRLAARHIFINTGTRAAIPSTPGLDRVPFLDASSIQELHELPDHLLVIGGSSIGLEFGQMFRRFGSRVSIIQRGRQLMGREDPDVAEAVHKILLEDRLDVYLNAEVRQVGQEHGDIVLTLQLPAGPLRLHGSHVLVATGRIPNSDDLNLAAAGVGADAKGYITVNERLETSVPGVYALGDVKGGPAFTHIAYDDYRVLKANLLAAGNATTSGRPVPYTVFIDPQLGRVGLTENEAKETGRRLLLARLPVSRVARALETGETRGFIKAVVDAETGFILGCAVLAPEGGELMTILQLAMAGGIPYARLRDAIFAHPTLAESLNGLFAAPEPL
ncbi:MAG: mercuric reductase [Thiobacillus sp.]|jgi:pyruvate/2-oxoglutarate dehydrogenase complex dihydrolipoamide dehydrogenase (E3) component|uniref:mercuric reductase n=1 Tax=Thiobacillus sp. TaxID=924 RepID=UPI002895E237|nr:mercuric reductase [Thiobacillus sp.]MDT3706541.1 mercuric reductase [Thiobacillus sp.]